MEREYCRQCRCQHPEAISICAQAGHDGTYENASSDAEEGGFSTTAPTRRQVPVIRIHSSSIDGIHRFQMHNGLRLCSPRKEYAALVPKRIIKQVRTMRFANVRHKGGIGGHIRANHSLVLLCRD